MPEEKPKGWDKVGISIPYSSPDRVVFNWTTPATQIPEQNIGKYHIVKRSVNPGYVLSTSSGEVMFGEYATITLLRYGEKYRLDNIGLWMSDTPMEMWDMEHLVNRAEGPNVLVGGLGLGLLVHLLSNRRDILNITVVEISKEVIAMVKNYLPKSVAPTINIVHGDFLEKLREFEGDNLQFNTIIADIWPDMDAYSKRVFENTRICMETYYPDAKHLYWAYQQIVDYELVQMTKSNLAYIAVKESSTISNIWRK